MNQKTNLAVCGFEILSASVTGEQNERQYKLGFSDEIHGVLEEGPLDDTGYYLTEPLHYSMSKGECGWSGYIHLVDLPVYGETKEEVKADLSRAVVEYYEALRNQDDDKLGHMPMMHKNFLCAMIEESRGA